MAILSEDEYKVKSRLKKAGVFKRIGDQHGINLRDCCRNGGVAVVCGDGDIDARSFYKRAVSSRPHTSMNFGGPLLLTPSFAGYRTGFAHELMENIRAGMRVKDTDALTLYFHFPCGMAAAHGHDFTSVVAMIPEAVDEMTKNEFKHVIVLIHVKRLNGDGVEEQNTYLVYVDKLREFIVGGGLRYT